MYTIYDYLKYYKDYSLKDLKWNVMDNLLLSCLVYMPLKSFEYKDYKTLISEILESNVKDIKDLMVPKTLEIASIIKESKRYQNMKFYNFINQVNSKTQFGAITVVLDNIKIITFRGSDRSVIGWLENFRIAYLYPTYTQQVAIDYLNNNINLFDNNVYICGHSKGGNLSIVSAMELPSFKLRKIKNIYNFDGPGVRHEEFESLKYKRIKSKIVNIIPTSSYVGALLYNENYYVVKTSAHAINVHYPIYWNIFGIEFVKGNLSKSSLGLIKGTTTNLDKVPKDKLQEVLEESFKIFKKRETNNIKLTLNDLKNIVKNISKMDPEISKYVSLIFSCIINIREKNNEK